MVTMTDRILDALRDAGGERAMGELERELGSTKNTVRKHLQPLIDAGVVRAVGHGRYRLVGASPLTSASGKALLSVLEGGDYDAHLTGFDVLVPYAHQFVFAYPHLVNADPAVFDALAYELADDGFVVRAAGRRAGACHVRPVAGRRAAPAAQRAAVPRARASCPTREGVGRHAARNAARQPGTLASGARAHPAQSRRQRRGRALPAPLRAPARLPGLRRADHRARRAAGPAGDARAAAGFHA